MKIVIVAAKKHQDIIKTKIADTVDGSEVECFCDPMLAVQYIFNNEVDIVFVSDRQRPPLSGVQFVQMVRLKRPDIDISVISAGEGKSERFISAGADRLLKDDRIGEALKNISAGIQSPAGDADQGQ